ncbi:MAG: ATP-dependent zinc metalloprotease FtsH [Actinomycetota bacterium]|nr:ATP-dependent zinc metalloprotease FtsH [Actinomycetota bacterium]
MKRNFKNIALLILLVVVMFFIFRNPLFLSPQVKEITLNEFITKIESQEISTTEPITIKGEDRIVEGLFTDGTKFKMIFLSDYDISNLLIEKNIPFKVDNQQQSIWIQILVSALPFIIMFGLIFFLFNQMQGGGSKVMQFGKSKARVSGKGKNKVTFKDVAGVDEAIEELKEIEEFLEEPGKFKSMGAKIPKGVLLYGPPGTGKTLLARAVAGEAGVPFYSISGSEFVEMFVGVGASRVRDLFAQAKATQPSIIFMDEIDAVGRHRGAGLGGGHDEREQTLNQLLVEMDGFDVDSTVILIAATNRPDILDPALLRPGRFDRQIVVDRPDLIGREKILEVHAQGKPLDKDVVLRTIARQTPGFTGADIANLFNESALLAARHNKKKISMFEIEQAIERVIAGPEKKTRVISEKEKRIIAFHEAGHALLAYILPNTDPVYKISIISRGRALGYTITLPEEDRFLRSKSEIFDNIKMLLGGRVAEQLIFNDITSGAQNDIDRATKFARQMITEYGMSDKLGPVAFKGEQDEVFLGNQLVSKPHYSDKVASMIDDEVHSIVDSCYNSAKDLLIEHSDILNELSSKLIEKETLDKKEVIGILGKIEVNKNEGFRAKEYHDEEYEEKPAIKKRTRKSSVTKSMDSENLKNDISKEDD